MTEQLWKYLPHVPQTGKKPANFLKRKSEVTDKEVLNLTGGLFPLKIVDPISDINKMPQKLDHWIYTPIIQRNNKIGPVYHWIKEGEQKKIYHGDKFNVQPDIVDFTQQQYEEVRVLHPQWPYADVKQLFKLMRIYNLNFIVVYDRFESSKTLSLEDMKDIYFTVSKIILTAKNNKQHPLSNFVFDKKYEVNRKFQLEKFMMRSKNNNDQQRFLINEIRRLQILIKKQQREQINLKKALKLDEIPEQGFQLNAIEPETSPADLRTNQRVYSRQQYLTKPLQLPGKISDRLTQVMHGMNIPDKIIATQQNEQLYDKLRKKILLMFSIQRYIRKKQNQKRLLEEKKKKLISGMEDEQKKKNIPLDGNPKKKIHPNIK